MPRRASLIVVIAVISSLIPAAMLEAQAPASRLRTPASLPISAIAITGNKTFSTDAILAASGLKINEIGGSAIFDAARDRLLDTGYFDLVSYTFRQQDLGFAITFSVAEVKQIYPLHLEALPITLDEVKRILKARDPLFDGLLPANKQVLDRAAAAVEQSLATANPGLRVRATIASAGADRYQIQFAPAEGLPVIADVTFEGSVIAKESDLREVMIENGIGQFFSDAGIRALLDRLIRPVFEKNGYMRVSFPEITTQPAAKVKGLDVHVKIVDGPRFKLGAVSVRGPMANQSARILRIANLPRGEFANGDDLQQAVTRIHDTLKSEGYLDVTVSTDHSVNNATTTIDAWFEVDPGVVYTFGHLEVLNLGLDGEAAIRKLWNVKPGDPFPGAYPDHFVEAVKDEGLFDNLGVITATPSINKQTHVVDVSLHFATAPPASHRAQF